VPAQKAADRLYGLPLEQFIAERNKAAKELRAKGNAQAADEVAALPKPTLAAWALNQAQREDPNGVNDLIEAAERVRKAQEKLLRDGDRGALDQATQDERRLAERVAGAAERALDNPSGATIDKVRGTLSGLPLDEGLQAELRQGRLAKERDSAGGFGLPAQADLPKSPRRNAARAARKAEEKAAQRLDAAERKLAERERSLRDAERRLSEAESDVHSARAMKEAAEKEVAAARGGLRLDRRG